MYARGAKPGGQAWSVAVQHPEQEGYAAMLALTDAFAVTSGGYQRYFTGPDGTVYQHILNPKTGWPVQGICCPSPLWRITAPWPTPIPRLFM